jgi:hypothetical protein
MPNKAVSIAGGNGGLSLCPVTKWLSAVWTGSGRPGRASAAVGKVVRLRNKNMDRLLGEHHQSQPNMGLVPQLYKTEGRTGAETEGAGVHRLEKPNFGAGLLPSLVAKPPVTPRASHVGKRKR